MAISSHDMIPQLSGQLHMISEIAESLTLRLLALEERHNELSSRLESVEPDQAEDSDSCLLLADSSDRLVQLRGLLNERSEDEAPVETPSLGLVSDSHDNLDTAQDESEDFDFEQTEYVNDSQESPLETLDLGLDQSDELLSA
ncbi:hypothetical protein WB44_13770 [Synechococcus sp. WH 8020]|uniref:hypothetical protein n=1 Tax=unclassified Synechococcus TaxID=2626047 RepID=UPI0006526FE4|nr:hypothetical protein [Synechococcus sp. WH 8020]AKN61990.1 hypothetical protein WB44_13770 [Synechococcus sp. WH 8020]